MEGLKTVFEKLEGGKSHCASPTSGKSTPSAPRRLKVLRSIGSPWGKGNNSPRRSNSSPKPLPLSPQLPQIDTSLALAMGGRGSRTPESSPEPPPSSVKRRSIQPTAGHRIHTTHLRIPSPPSRRPRPMTLGTSYGASLASALVAASRTLNPRKAFTTTFSWS